MVYFAKDLFWQTYVYYYWVGNNATLRPPISGILVCEER
jgi:hypothetical protein